MLLNGGPTFKFSQAISLFVSCETQAEVDDYWSKLTAGGKEIQCGWLVDKFGVSWQIIPTILMQADGRQGREEGGARDAGDDEDGEDRHQGPAGGGGRLTAGRGGRLRKNRAELRLSSDRCYGQAGETSTLRAISASSFPGNVTSRSTSAVDGPPLAVQVAVPITGPAPAVSALRVGHSDGR